MLQIDIHDHGDCCILYLRSQVQTRKRPLIRTGTRTVGLGLLTQEKHALIRTNTSIADARLYTNRGRPDFELLAAFAHRAFSAHLTTSLSASDSQLPSNFVKHSACIVLDRSGPGAARRSPESTACMLSTAKHRARQKKWPHLRLRRAQRL